MKTLLLAALAVAFAAFPAHATTRLTDNGRAVPVIAPQWWLDEAELRLLLTDRSALRREAIIKAKRNGSLYDGSLWRNGQQRWVRCREG